MKKNYLKPEAEILDFVVANMIATSGNGAGVPEGPENEDAGVNKHRGEWGNVWAN